MEAETTTRWISRVLLPRNCQGYGTKFASHEALKSIAWRQVNCCFKGRSPLCGLRGVLQNNRALLQEKGFSSSVLLQGYLAHKKTPPHPRTTIGP